MKVYVFGNEDVECDKRAFEVKNKLEKKYCDISFVDVKPNENLPFDNHEDVVIMDVVDGLKEVTLIQNDDLDKIILPPRSSTHDFDLGFQIKYLKKLGKLGKATIIGLPMRGAIDYNRIHSILRKLVAQDMQGS